MIIYHCFFNFHDRTFNNPVERDHHVIKKPQISCLNKSDSKEVCNILIISDQSKTSAQTNHNFSESSELEWKNI